MVPCTAFVHFIFVLLLVLISAQPTLAQVAVSANPKFRDKNEFVLPEIDQEPDLNSSEDGRLENGLFSLPFESIPGELYYLDYWMGSRGGPEVGLLVEIFSSENIRLGFAETFFFSATPAWNAPGGFEFLATTPSSTLRLTDITPGGPASSGLILDSVIIYSIPEPGAFSLFTFGVLFLSLARRRRA